ncbi:DUF2207 domain-containing protein [Oscillospiraceae bacterium WX1]
MKKIFAIVILIAALAALLIMPAAAAEYFTISNYKVNVNISKNNTYDVTEVITVKFTEPRHGIYRNIPYNGTWQRDADHGGNTDWRAKISNIRVDGDNYSVSKSGGDVVIKIGDADKYVDGTQVYRISYSIQFYDDGLPTMDEVYYNIIGTKWDTTIDHASFSVTLPKSFDPATLGFSTGTYGTSGYDTASLTYQVVGNTITGEVSRPLASGQGVTMRLELPQGYFAIPYQGGPDVALLVGIAVLVLLAFVLFLLYGRDSKVVKTVEFYAPDGLTPAEVGYIIDGVVDNRDVVSLIIYWAHRGYLTIEDTGGSKFQFRKLREPDDDAQPFEKHMFQNLFTSGALVTSASLTNTFYTTVNSTKTMVSTSFDHEKRRVFTKTSAALRPLVSFMTALPVMLTLLLTNFRLSQDFTDTLITTAIFGILIMLPVMLLVSTLRRWRGKGPVSRVASLIAGILLAFIAMIFFLVMTADSVFVPALPLCAVLGTVLLGLIAAFIDKRTPQGTEWLGKISGFRDFLELAELDKLVALVEQDPKYFYNILPYAWVLNVSDKWAKKFETIAIQPPDWYYGHGGAFYPVMFMGDLNRSMNAVQSTMVSRPSSSGGGSGFSGGGFSGGGGGGGGGGSW